MIIRLIIEGIGKVRQLHGCSSSLSAARAVVSLEESLEQELPRLNRREVCILGNADRNCWRLVDDTRGGGTRTVNYKRRDFDKS